MRAALALCAIGCSVWVLWYALPGPHVRLAGTESVQGLPQGASVERHTAPGTMPDYTLRRSTSRRPFSSAVPSRTLSEAAARVLDVDAGESDGATSSDELDVAERGGANAAAVEPTPLPRRPALSPFPRANFAPDHVDVVVLCDANYAMGVAAIINAARKHTRVPVRVL